MPNVCQKSHSFGNIIWIATSSSFTINNTINDVINGNLQDKKENKEITILQTDNSSSVVVGLFFEKYERSRIVLCYNNAPFPRLRLHR